MIRALLASQIKAFERQWGYDAGYMHALLESAGSWTFFKFTLVSSLGRGRRAPVQAMAAVGVVGTLTEDCGPCTQIGVDLAAANGCPADVLKAILAGDEAAMGEAARLGYRFAKAVLERDMDRADPLRDEIVRRWGKRGLADLGLALTTARMYPTLKYALGYGKACSRVMVAGAPAPFHRPEPLAA